MGHLIPLVEFAKRLLLHHDFTVTLILPSFGPPPKAQLELLQSLPISITHIFLSPVCFHDLPAHGVKQEIKIFLSVTRSLSSIRDALKSLVSTTRLVGLVVDLFGTDAFDVAKEFDISSYLFFPTMAVAVSLFLYLPSLDEAVSCEYRDMPEPVRLPGCVDSPIHGRDFPEPLQDRKNDAYKLFVYHSKRCSLAAGMVLNSFMELEAECIQALQEAGEPPVYPIGPLVQTGSSSGGVDGSECLRWLDDQPRGSVLFVSFGSGGTLSYAQLNELALGLEMSGQKFLWVVRSPDDGSASASFFSAQSHEDPFNFLPKGFLERTKGRGVVVPSWAPQIEVLSHGSTGGFITHCGWNSILESVVNGVPLIAWPLYAEQKLNAISLTEVLKVALRPERNENGLVGRMEIAKLVKALMEGEEGTRIRDQMNCFKEAAVKATSKDGSSTKSLSELVLQWKKH
jgi:hydroquinone glucosyltransferase